MTLKYYASNSCSLTIFTYKLLAKFANQVFCLKDLHVEWKEETDMDTHTHN